MNEYRYRLVSTKHSSARFGPCEVCGKHASEVFLQTEEMKYFDPDLPEEASWTQYQCKTLFGHKECLLSKRR